MNFVRGTLFSRLVQPAQGRIVVIMQRLHENDLVGELLNPPRDAGAKRLDTKEQKSDRPAPRVDYSGFTPDLMVCLPNGQPVRIRPPAFRQPWKWW